MEKKNSTPFSSLNSKAKPKRLIDWFGKKRKRWRKKEKEWWACWFCWCLRLFKAASQKQINLRQRKSQPNQRLLIVLAPLLFFPSLGMSIPLGMCIFIAIAALDWFRIACGQHIACVWFGRTNIFSLMFFENFWFCEFWD